MFLFFNAISTEPVFFGGTSAEATNITIELAKTKRYLQESDTMGGDVRTVTDELCDVYNECKVPDWAGYTSEPITQETFETAFTVLQSMPLGSPMPSIGAEVDGHLTMDWHSSPHRSLSLSISSSGDLHYASLIGGYPQYGTIHFYGEFPTVLQGLISAVCNK